MKKYLPVLLLLISLSLGTFGQQKAIGLKDLPTAVTKQFHSLFPLIVENTWKLTTGFNYEVSFVYNSNQTKALFDEFGNILQTETFLTDSYLPRNAFQYLSLNYPLYKIEKLIKNESGNEVFYFVKVNKGTENTLRIVFDMSGNYVKTLFE